MNECMNELNEEGAIHVFIEKGELCSYAETLHSARGKLCVLSTELLQKVAKPYAPLEICTA